MKDMLTEEQMRLALFGSATPPAHEEARKRPVAAQASLPVAKPKAAKSRSSSPRVRVTLHVTKEFEGDVEVFIHLSSTLSTLLAEQEAKQAAKKKKFKYIEVISVTQI
ncbi:hypothetical protein VT47_09850 [Pseudomonas syringae pv. syringae]|uniref:hypothetical protein n=1 Tax=Pseudomonas syringae TaxID=317 RepID=UPI0007AE7E9D|nr:hypothetical protein [Pseudomonas syringae]KZL39466.1 hypothetical protein VT47_09850 [Pseudomonas syringae pv. syringae]